MLIRQLIKKALLSAFFYCCPIAILYADTRILEDLAPKVKSFVVLNYYDLKREASLYSPDKINEILFELNCKQNQVDKSLFLTQFSETKDPIEAVRLIEEIELLCSK